MFNKLENWLPTTLVNELDNIFTGDKVAWIYTPSTVNYNEVNKVDGIADSHQFVHLLYDQGQPISHLWESVRPIIHFFEYHKNIEVIELGRIKANMLFQDTTTKSSYNTPHIDVHDDGWTSLVYYVNNSDGPTVMFDNDFKETDRSIFEQGSAVYFPSNKLHSSTNPFNNYRRIVINITMKTKEIK